jgi:hypothetical protein
VNTCGVQTCTREGTEEVSEDCWLCVPHSVDWDFNEDARNARLYVLWGLRPDAPLSNVRAEHFSEWCGEQR